MIFVDASYIIALIIEKDEFHEKALQLLPKIESHEKVITMPMVVETINLIGSCNGGKVGYTVYRYIKDNYTIINYETLLDESIYYFLKYDGTLSLADSTAIQVMKSKKIHEIYSFDSDFDKVEGIIRIH
ncbi:type II toxin-antitoxin system VapC family toxin [Methanosphaera sp.]|jgi:predicted nucleic acid-binding protein|uniref:type II toxin-antitoxin system VapC family toxin n=1 Tax=Methanosphaera sp. TaxID=2666342 RepID=UPI002E79D332|nr:PIN domain-containing protein [Methanosphaera sp.]MEE1117217.1 PIN domain-containing protein [Methanosphaera sp.]